jgi:hypothetical protein
MVSGSDVVTADVTAPRSPPSMRYQTTQTLSLLAGCFMISGESAHPSIHGEADRDLSAVTLSGAANALETVFSRLMSFLHKSSAKDENNGNDCGLTRETSSLIRSD